jgi:hypothetical protein
MRLSSLEHDLLGDLAEDTHGVWEVFEFVRCHNPNAPDTEVFSLGRELIESWINRGWIVLAANHLYPTSVSKMSEPLPALDRLGSQATRYFDGAPSIDIAPKAYNDVDWLNQAT